MNPAAFVFSPENFRRPDLPKGHLDDFFGKLAGEVLSRCCWSGLNVLDIDPQVASDSTLAGLGRHITKIAFSKTLVCNFHSF